MLKIQKMLGLALLAALAACGSNGGGPAPVQDFGAFRASVEEFEALAHTQGQPGLRVTNLIIKYGPVSSAQTVAECTHGSNMNPTITVDAVKFGAYGALQQRAILFHEMGHCVLDRRHLNTLRQVGAILVPTSYLYAAIADVDVNLLTDYQPTLDRELFNPSE